MTLAIRASNCSFHPYSWAYSAPCRDKIQPMSPGRWVRRVNALVVVVVVVVVMEQVLSISLFRIEREVGC